jgi:ParB family chromosome partitioning protein
VARMVSKDRATVANLIRLLKLPKEMQKAIIDRKITAGHARALLSVEDHSSQKALFIEIEHKGLSVREAEEKAKGAASGKKSAKAIKPSLKDPEIASLEEELRRIFGTKVQILNKRGNKGKLVVEYYTLDDFDRILEVVRK